MLSLIVVALVTVAAGFVVWANDKRHAKYGIAVPAGVSPTVGMLSWIAFMAAGLGYQPGLTWIPWVLPMVPGRRGAAWPWPGRAAAPRQDPHQPRQPVPDQAPHRRPVLGA